MRMGIISILFCSCLLSLVSIKTCVIVIHMTKR